MAPLPCMAQICFSLPRQRKFLRLKVVTQGMRNQQCCARSMGICGVSEGRRLVIARRATGRLSAWESFEALQA
jgi:hypothetical protein